MKQMLSDVVNPKRRHLNASPVVTKTKTEQAIALEREAHRFRGEGKIDRAFQAFDQAAQLFQESKEPLKAAACYSAAAACWNIHTGWQPLRNAATRTESAAIQALEAGDHAYAETLFSEAALLYEKEGDHTKDSYCYCRAKDIRLERLWKMALQKNGGASGRVGLEEAPGKERLVAFFRWLLGSLDRIVWGYGEMPLRVFGVACGVIVLSAFCYYMSGMVFVDGTAGQIDLFESLYLSVMTYAAAGYGDYLPVGWVRNVAAVEVLLGVFFTPLFLISLTRRYLKVR